MECILDSVGVPFLSLLIQIALDRCMRTTWVLGIIAALVVVGVVILWNVPVAETAVGTLPGVKRAVLPDLHFFKLSTPKGPPTVRLVKGKPIDLRNPEKPDDKPAFPGQTRAPYEPTAPFNVITLTSKLSSPWSFAFLPEGKILITERLGSMRTLSQDGTLSEPIQGVPEVFARGRTGLLDVALDPEFGSNRRLFFTYGEKVDADHSVIAVARGRLDANAVALTKVKVIFRALPALSLKYYDDPGGRIAIGRDGNLFVTIGDRSERVWNYPQELDNHLGKIVRITPDGAAAPGNPFLGKTGALPEIWSYGHRSEEGLAIHPETGALWETEHGPRGGDEINLLEAGGNYGWPVIVHGVDYYGRPIGSGKTEQPGMEQPRYYWDPVIAPSGLAFYSGSLFPQWKNSVFVGALRGQILDRLSLSGDRVIGEEPLLMDQRTRIRDVRVGPEGAVYVLTERDSLLKLTPK
jgi:aldose sugar dehydrogenase